MNCKQIGLALTTALGIFSGIFSARIAHADYPHEYGSIYMGESKDIGCKLYGIKEKDTFLPTQAFVVAICDTQPVCTTTQNGKTTTTVCTKTSVDK